MSGLRGALLVAAGLALAGVAAWWTLVFFLQRAVLFPRSLAVGAEADPARAGGERWWLALPEGRVEAWWLPAERTAAAETRGAGPEPGPRPLALFAHGNGETIDLWLDELARLRAWGVSLLLVEFPGYGRSQGSPTQRSVTAAMAAAYDRAAARPDVDRERIVGYGRSVGAGAVCALARERPLAALVLESPFASVRAMARGFGLPGFLVRDPFDNEAVLRAFPGPVLIAHGERDEIIPPSHAHALHAAAPRSELHLLPCGHNDCPRPWDALEAFLAAHGLL